MCHTVLVYVELTMLWVLSLSHSRGGSTAVLIFIACLLCCSCSLKGGWTQPLSEGALLCTAPSCSQTSLSHTSNALLCLGFVCTGAAPASAPSWQDGISEATRWWLGLGDCCRFLLHPVPVLWITAGGGSLVFGVAGCFWRRERQDCLGWITSKWNWIACQ